MSELNERNRKLFQPNLELGHDQLLYKMSKWISAYTDARSFYLKNKIVLKKEITATLDKNIAQLMGLAVKLQDQEVSLTEAEVQLGGIHRLYDNLQQEQEEIYKILEKWISDADINYIIDSIDVVINDVQREFDKIVK
jgi:hypothetical protein